MADGEEQMLKNWKFESVAERQTEETDTEKLKFELMAECQTEESRC